MNIISNEKKSLYVLYAAHDDEYAPFLGISMNSLFENNKDLDEITVYAVLGNVSKDNIDKLNEVSKKYNRNLKIIKSGKFDKKLESLNIPKYRGTYGTCYRLFFNEIIDENIKRLVYIDCDTVICGSLVELITKNFENKPVAVVKECLGKFYKKLIGFSDEEVYFNAGVLVIDVDTWKRQRITEVVFDHAKNVRARYCSPDQDLLNIVLKNNVFVLMPEYNFMPSHSAYSDKTYGKVFGFKNYYSEEEIENARKNPKIIHMYRFLGEFPWHKNGHHPNAKVFDYYLSISPWKDYQKKASNNDSLLFKIERVMYCLLPRTLFFMIFTYIQLASFKRQNKKLLETCS